MKLGVMSDTHNNESNTRQALEIMRERGVDRIIHCGDITGPKIVELFHGWRVDFLQGNIDRDLDSLRGAVAELGQSSIGRKLVMEIDGVKVAATHGDDQALLKELIRSGNYRFVFHGHSHQRRDEMIAGTRVINPGALGGKRPQTRSVCIIEPSTNDVEFVTVVG